MHKKQVIARNINNKKEKVAVDKLIFRPSIYGVIIKKGKILLSPQWKGYDFPGGGIRLGETLDQALRREVWEETGLKVRRDKVIAVESDFFIGPETGSKYHSILIYCLCKDVRGRLSTSHLGKFERTYARKAVWLPLSEIGKIKFYNPVNSVAIIKRALSFPV